MDFPKHIDTSVLTAYQSTVLSLQEGLRLVWPQTLSFFFIIVFLLKKEVQPVFNKWIKEAMLRDMIGKSNNNKDMGQSRLRYADRTFQII